MNFKKFALLILTVVVISGFYAKPVSASANDNATAAQTLETEGAASEVSGEEKTDLAADDKEMTADLETADNGSTVASPSPKCTPAAQKAAKPAAKSASEASYSKSDLRLMASIINCEAGAEGFQGKLAVGIVVMNRVASKKFPNTIKKVIYEKGQFSPVRNGMLAKKLKQYDAGRTASSQWKSCISAAKKVLSGQRTIIYKGKTKSLKGYHFFSVVLPGARIKLGGHRFK